MSVEFLARLVIVVYFYTFQFLSGVIFLLKMQQINFPTVCALPLILQRVKSAKFDLSIGPQST